MTITPLFVAILTLAAPARARESLTPAERDARERVRAVDAQPRLPKAALKDRLESTILQLGGVAYFTLRDEGWVIGVTSAEAGRRVGRVMAGIDTLQGVPMIIKLADAPDQEPASAVSTMHDDDLVRELGRTLSRFKGVRAVTRDAASVIITVEDAATARSMTNLFPAGRRLGSLGVEIRVEEPVPPPAEPTARVVCDTLLAKTGRALRWLFAPPVDLDPILDVD